MGFMQKRRLLYVVVSSIFLYVYTFNKTPNKVDYNGTHDATSPHSHELKNNTEHMKDGFTKGLKLSNFNYIDKLELGNENASGNEGIANEANVRVLNDIDQRKLTKAMRFSKWCKRQLRFCTGTVYRDKHAIKRILPTLAPGLGFAEEYAYVSSAAEITEELLAKLPHSYFMKATHKGASSGMVLVQGSSVSCLKCDLCMETGGSYNGSLASYLRTLCHSFLNSTKDQRCFALIPRKCIFEEQLNIGKSTGVTDYKVFTFQGRPIYIKIYSERMARRVMIGNYRTPSWVEIAMHDRPKGKEQERLNLPTKPPVFWPELLRYSTQIGKLFAHARVDFFVFGDEYRFAEITRYHDACNFKFNISAVDRFLGYLIQNPQASVEPDYILRLTNQTQPVSFSNIS